MFRPHLDMYKGVFRLPGTENDGLIGGLLRHLTVIFASELRTGRPLDKFRNFEEKNF